MSLDRQPSHGEASNTRLSQSILHDPSLSAPHGRDALGSALLHPKFPMATHSLNTQRQRCWCFSGRRQMLHTAPSSPQPASSAQSGSSCTQHMELQPRGCPPPFPTPLLDPPPPIPRQESTNRGSLVLLLRDPQAGDASRSAAAPFLQAEDSGSTTQDTGMVILQVLQGRRTVQAGRRCSGRPLKLQGRGPRSTTSHE